MRKTVIVMLLGGASLFSQAQAMDLMQAYKQALNNDAVLASARASLTASQETLVQGRAGLLPTATLRAGQSRTELEQQNRDYRRKEYTLSLSQPLFNLTNWEAYQQSKLLTETGVAQFAQAQQELILRLSEAYFNVLVAKNELSSILAQKEAISEQLAFAKRNFEVGTATITDTHEAQARYDLIAAQELAARNNLLIARSALQLITGNPVENLAELRQGVELNPPLPAQVEAWINSAEKQNYAVITQELALEVARREINRNRAAHAPTIDLVASRGYVDQTGTIATTGDASSTSNTIGVQLNIPLFAGFAISSRVDEAIALHERARADLVNVRRNAAQAARQAYFSVTSGLGQIRALQAAEVSSLSALEANRLGYQVGVRINIDVLNAQQQLFAARRDLSRARYEALLNSLRLKAAAGTLTEIDVHHVNDLLEYRAETKTQ
jgi:outer membrane protein